MSRPRAARAALIVAAGLGVLPAARHARAQAPAHDTTHAAVRPSWYVTFSLGLVGREIRTWKPTHLALDSTGWDGKFPGGCVVECPNAADVVEGRPPVPTLAARRRLHRNWQLRGFVSSAAPGYYPGQDNTSLQPLAVRPRTATVAAQAAFGFRSFWLAAGPSFYAGRVTVEAGSVAVTEHQSGLGAALAGGLMLPKSSRWYMDLMIERRFAGTIVIPTFSVPGAPDVPELSVPLSATVLSVGLGWRR